MKACNTNQWYKAFAKSATGAILLLAGSQIAQGQVNAMFIDEFGNVGVGTDNPVKLMHVASESDAFALIQNTTGSKASRTMLELRNSGASRFRFVDISANPQASWNFAGSSVDFRITFSGSGTTDMRVLPGGNMIIGGVLTENSDVNAKTHIRSVDHEAVLNSVKALDIKRWQYKDALGEDHIGPMAQDFYARFGLGANETGIATLDTSGVALASIKALAEQNTQLKSAHRELLDAYHDQADELQQLRKNQIRMETVLTKLLLEGDDRVELTSID